MKRDTAFTNLQFDEIHPEGIENHFWYVARNGMILDLIRWIERRQGHGIGRMLEVGCGRGMVVDYLRSQGRDCYGVELAPVPIAERLKAHVWAGQDCLTLPADVRSSIELILLLDVIEHIEDASEFLNQLKEGFPQCRWLIVSVPARMELWSNFDELYGHFRRYDEHMLTGEFARAGARLIRWRYRFVPLYPLVYAVVRSRKGRPSRNRIPTQLLLHRLLGALIRRENWFVPRFVYGTSIVGAGEFMDRNKPK